MPITPERTRGSHGTRRAHATAAFVDDPTETTL